MNKIVVPVLSMGGWFDTYASGDLDMFSRLSSEHHTIETWIGPWAHNPSLKFRMSDFGPQASIGIRARQAAWFDRWLKTQPVNEHPEAQDSLLHIFVMGRNAWREEHEWPLARTRYTSLYLSSNGHANSSSGDGMLRWRPARKALADAFTYDPRNPVPTMGGATCCEASVLPAGPLDQTAVERRPDVLVYTSPALAEDLEVTGPVRVVLYIATSANDTDFTAKLVDLAPDGRPLLVTDGIQRLRYRLSLNHPAFAKRNTAYQINIDAGVTSFVFAAGHRIRLEISSSNFPRFDRNLNSLRANADETKFTEAQQTVFHERGYASALILPVIPAIRPTRAPSRSGSSSRSSAASGDP